MYDIGSDVHNNIRIYGYRVQNTRHRSRWEIISGYTDVGVLPTSGPICHLRPRSPLPAALATAQALQPLQPLGPQPAWTLLRRKGQCLGYCLHPCALAVRATQAAVKGPAPGRGHPGRVTVLCQHTTVAADIYKVQDTGSQYIRCKTLAPSLVDTCFESGVPQAPPGPSLSQRVAQGHTGTLRNGCWTRKGTSFDCRHLVLACTWALKQLKSKQPRVDAIAGII